MKAIICEEFGPLEDLVYGDMADPVPGPGQILIRTEAAGVNYPDGLLVQGKYQAKPERPFVPGNECAGEVVALGEGVTRFAIGDKVVSYGSGGYAELCLGDEDKTFARPDGMDAADACAMLIAWGTSHHALKQRGALQAGESLVIFGAAGATGTAAIQIGKVMGAKVIAVCSTDDKRKVALENGADHAIGYDNLKEDIKALTDGKGADVVYDSVGGDAFKAASRFMAPDGRLLVIGFAGGEIPQLPVNLTLVKEYAVVGVFWGNWTRRKPAEYLANMEELFGWYSSGQIKPLIEGRYPLKDAAEVLSRVMNRGAVGKIALVP